MISLKKRVTVDFDSKSYYLDGEYWKSWDSYGEEMADEINKLLDKQDKEIALLKESNEALNVCNQQVLKLASYLVYYKKIRRYERKYERGEK